MHDHAPHDTAHTIDDASELERRAEDDAIRIVAEAIPADGTAYAQELADAYQLAIDEGTPADVRRAARAALLATYDLQHCEDLRQLGRLAHREAQAYVALEQARYHHGPHQQQIAAAAAGWLAERAALPLLRYHDDEPKARDAATLAARMESAQALKELLIATFGADVIAALGDPVFCSGPMESFVDVSTPAAVAGTVTGYRVSLLDPDDPESGPQTETVTGLPCAPGDTVWICGQRVPGRTAQGATTWTREDDAELVIPAGTAQADALARLLEQLTGRA